MPPKIESANYIPPLREHPVDRAVNSTTAVDKPPLKAHETETLAEKKERLWGEVKLILDALRLDHTTTQQIKLVYKHTLSKYFDEGGIETKGMSTGYHGFEEHIQKTVIESLIAIAGAETLLGDELATLTMFNMQNSDRFNPPDKSTTTLLSIIEAREEAEVSIENVQPEEQTKIKDRMFFLLTTAWLLHDQEIVGKTTSSGLTAIDYPGHETRAITNADKNLDEITRSNPSVVFSAKERAVIKYLIAQTCISQDKYSLIKQTYSELKTAGMDEYDQKELAVVAATVSAVDIASTSTIETTTNFLEEGLEQQIGVPLKTIDSLSGLPNADGPLENTGDINIKQWVPTFVETNRDLFETLGMLEKLAITRGRLSTHPSEHLIKLVEQRTQHNLDKTIANLYAFTHELSTNLEQYGIHNGTATTQGELYIVIQEMKALLKKQRNN